ncbi:MAG TPA: flagellar M-ring protein FliF C-terminal domain-containing protein [Tepidisphaeraceae bacterium]
MDFLRAQLQKIREQLAGLNASQRMLAGALVVIMVMTLLWWSRYAGTSEMDDLLGMDFSAEDIVHVTNLLDTKGIQHKVIGARVQVPADRRFEALALLTYEQIGPRDTSAGFDDIITKMDSPWNTHVKEDAMFTRAKEATIGQIMREWPDIRDARVIINAAQKRTFGEADVQPSATVSLKTKNPGSKPPKRLIGTAADTIAGAVAGLVRSKVNVIIDGASYNVPDKDADGLAGGDTWMELVKEGERHFSQKIQDRLGWIEGVMVSVTVDPELQARQIEKETYDKDHTFEKLSTSTERNEETSNSTRGPTEPGAVPNTTGGANQPTSIGAAASGAANSGASIGNAAEGSSSTTTETTIKNQIFPSVVKELIKSPAGAAAVIGASVSIPRSYFVKIYRTAFPTNKDPDEAALQPFMDKEMVKIKNAVLGCVGKTPEDKVLVDYYYDYVPAGDATAASAGQPAAATSIPLALTGHLKEIALGALAVVSLFMVSMMVRKATPAPIIPPQIDKPARAAAAPPEEPVAEAGEGMQEMDAIEIDNNSVRNQQIISQVADMVKENPEGAASLVKRWLSRA